ncbi:hypothetical protein FOC4_g10003040 [Fusarium odoratissimum]|uniref:Uncharacterized protein n=1 Tax=Fusarium oxysporum f. sp. cubense (strain race 4) TaxID=2502994 RepID=N1RJI1_FUSC4|nr:hypothetical protein FOC4_g10003040 [Fusarium odoratissimum]
MEDKLLPMWRRPLAVGCTTTLLGVLGTTSVDALLFCWQQLAALRQAACSVPVCVWLALPAYRPLVESTSVEIHREIALNFDFSPVLSWAGLVWSALPSTYILLLQQLRCDICMYVSSNFTSSKVGILGTWSPSSTPLYTPKRVNGFRAGHWDLQEGARRDHSHLLRRCDRVMTCPHRSVSQIALDCYQRQHVVLGLILYFLVARSPANIRTNIHTPDERVVYLGPWEVVGSEQRRVLWQGSYQNELLEHFLPSDTPSDIYPHTLHSRHRPYYDPSDMERYLTFQEPHRIRYTTEEGVCIHDQYVTIRYEFTTVESSIQFQGDLRRKDLVDFYDVDVVWTNVHGRTDGFGKVKGIGAIQRLKLWRDRYTTFHSLSVCANKTDGQYREYDIHSFDGELRGRDDRAKQLRLNASGRRHTSGDDQHSHRRFSLPHRMRSRTRTNDSSEPRSLQQPTLDIRYLAIQFTERQG